MRLLESLVALDNLHKILVTKDNTWHQHFAIDFMNKQCNWIIYIYLHMYYLDYTYIIGNFINLNLYHVDTCHYLG
jgi:hypothetical protein